MTGYKKLGLVKRYIFCAMTIASLSVACFVLPVFAALRNVPQDYPAIQSAIDASISGDTVNVSAGIYQESVVIKSGVILRGRGLM